MKELKKQSLLAIGGLAMVMNAGVASSSTTHASAMIDWTTFKITGYALGPASASPNYTLSGQTSNSWSNISDWASWSSGVSNTGRLFGANTEGTGAGSGSVSAQRYANLAISGSGFLIISANYILDAAINGTVCADTYCYDQNSASASVSFNLTNYSSSGDHASSSQAGISLGNSWYWPYSGLTSDHKEGTLSVGVLVNDGDLLNFSSAVSTTAHEVANSAGDPISSVPVPAAMWLFGSALLGVVGMGGQRRVADA